MVVGGGVEDGRESRWQLEVRLDEFRGVMVEGMEVRVHVVGLGGRVAAGGEDKWRVVDGGEGIGHLVVKVEVQYR